MPLYEYRCPQGHVTELQRTPDRAGTPVHCPDCGQTALRVYQLRAVHFKSPGFYTTDTRPSATSD